MKNLIPKSGVVIFALIVVSLLSSSAKCSPLEGNNTIPKEVDNFIKKNLPQRFNNEKSMQSYRQGYNEGFKSSLICQSSYLQRSSGDEANDSGWKDGRKVGLMQPLPDELKTVNLTHYGFTEDTVEGLVYFNFEQSDFRPFNSTETWWVVNCEALSGYNKIKEEIEKEKVSRLLIYVKAKALVSPPSLFGGYGHMGSYDREVFITDVQEIRKSTEKERSSRKEKQGIFGK